MNEGIHLDLDTWIVPGQIRKANLSRGLGNRYTPAGTEVLISAVAHNTPPPFQAAQNDTTVNIRSSVAPCTAQRHTPVSHECHPGVKRIGTPYTPYTAIITYRQAITKLDVTTIQAGRKQASIKSRVQFISNNWAGGLHCPQRLCL